jgi:hypothetical protein
VRSLIQRHIAQLPTREAPHTPGLRQPHQPQAAL